MEYNTQRPEMILPEYGRNVQNMIAFAMKLESKEERNSAAKAIIEVMGQLNPHLRDVDDFRHKLWTHLFVMSDFKFDADSPYEMPTREALAEKPNIMAYPKSKIRFGHYGKYTEKILDTILEEEDEKAQAYLKLTMGNFMKKQFLAYNNDAVENNLIAQQFSDLSGGKLKLDNPENLMPTNQILKTFGITPNNKRQKTSPGAQTNQAKKKFKKKF
jgi:hypothetical protein